MKKVFISIISLIIIGSAVFFYFSQNNSNKIASQKTAVSSEAETKSIQSPKNIKVAEKPIFTPSDAKVLNIALGMKKAEVEQILGKPLEIKKECPEGADGEQLQYLYQFGVVKLDPVDLDVYAVRSIEINKPNFQGPRNTSVGADWASVIDKFPNSNESKINEFNEQCLYGKHEDSNRGLMMYDNNGNIDIVAYYFDGEDGGGYGLIYSIQNKKVTSISISVSYGL